MEGYGGSTWGRLLSVLTLLLCHCYQTQFVVTKSFNTCTCWRKCTVFAFSVGVMLIMIELWMLCTEFTQLCECVCMERVFLEMCSLIQTGFDTCIMHEVHRFFVKVHVPISLRATNIYTCKSEHYRRLTASELEILGEVQWRQSQAKYHDERT